jgi:NTP pyrophosphatase (non-canonical NTP hydrolase)
VNTLKELANKAMEMSLHWFPEVADSLQHHTLGLAGEVGEFANLVKKIDRGDTTVEEIREQLGEEAIDVLIYLLNIFAVLEIDPDMVLYNKNNANWDRFGTVSAELRG